MTVAEKWERIEECLNNLDINYEREDTSAFIEFWTDTAGQDICAEFDYDGTPEDFVKKYTEYAEGYDVDDEVELYAEMRGKQGVPKSIRTLLDDCQEAKDTLMEIARALQKVLKDDKEIAV